MGTFTEEITLLNERDKVRVDCGALKEARQITLDALVDTGAMTLVINGKVCEALGLDIEGSRPAHVADGRQVETLVTSPVRVCWKNRFMTCSARMVRGAKDVLLGAIPLEDMDLTVDMAHRCLAGVHGDIAIDDIL